MTNSLIKVIEENNVPDNILIHPFKNKKKEIEKVSIPFFINF
jgi:hypothetical protein